MDSHIQNSTYVIESYTVWAYMCELQHLLEAEHYYTTDTKYKNTVLSLIT